MLLSVSIYWSPTSSLKVTYSVNSKLTKCWFFFNFSFNSDIRKRNSSFWGRAYHQNRPWSRSWNRKKCSTAERLIWVGFDQSRQLTRGVCSTFDFWPPPFFVIYKEKWAKSSKCWSNSVAWEDCSTWNPPQNWPLNLAKSSQVQNKPRKHRSVQC